MASGVLSTVSERPEPTRRYLTETVQPSASSSTVNEPAAPSMSTSEPEAVAPEMRTSPLSARTSRRPGLTPLAEGAAPAGAPAQDAAAAVARAAGGGGCG